MESNNKFNYIQIFKNDKKELKNRNENWLIEIPCDEIVYKVLN